MNSSIIVILVLMLRNSRMGISQFQTVQPNNFVERDLRQEEEIIIWPRLFYWSPAQLAWQNKPVTPILPKPRPYNCREWTQTWGKTELQRTFGTINSWIFQVQSGTESSYLAKSVYIMWPSTGKPCIMHACTGYQSEIQAKLVVYGDNYQFSLFGIDR